MTLHDGAGEDHVKLLSLVDVFEPLSREEIDKINWQNLNTRLEPGEVFYTPMDLCETLFVLQSWSSSRPRASGTAPATGYPPATHTCSSGP